MSTIALDPEILFYDEPSAGLDPIVSGVIDTLMMDLSKKLGVTSVVVTHEMDSAMRIADRMCMLHEGKVVALGTRDEIRDSSDPLVRQFINAAETKEIIFVRGTTEAVNLVAKSYARPLLRAGLDLHHVAVAAHPDRDLRARVGVGDGVAHEVAHRGDQQLLVAENLLVGLGRLHELDLSGLGHDPRALERLVHGGADVDQPRLVQRVGDLQAGEVDDLEFEGLADGKHPRDLSINLRGFDFNDSLR